MNNQQEKNLFERKYLLRIKAVCLFRSSLFQFMSNFQFISKFMSKSDSQWA